jgi:hypothetical protein
MDHPAVAIQSLISLSMLVGVAFLFERSYRENSVFNEECLSFDELLAWRRANPTLGVGDSGHARSLVLRRIRAYDRFSSLYILDPLTRIAHLSHLYALLEEHGDPPPSQRQILLFDTKEKQ